MEGEGDGKRSGRKGAGGKGLERREEPGRKRGIMGYEDTK